MKGLLQIQRAERTEDFATAMQRLNLTDEDIAARKNEFTRLFVCYLLLAIIVFSYAMYLFINGNWGGGIMTFCLVSYPVVLAFRYHFWLFQIKHKKLSCSLREWWNQ